MKDWEIGKVEGPLNFAVIYIGSDVSVDIRALESRLGEVVAPTFELECDRLRQLHEGLATRFCEPHSRGETLVCTTNLRLGKV